MFLFKHLVSQNGVLTRVEDIIEKEEWNVNKPDEQDVPLLHWASINNRQEVQLYWAYHASKPYL